MAHNVWKYSGRLFTKPFAEVVNIARAAIRSGYDLDHDKRVASTISSLAVLLKTAKCLYKGSRQEAVCAFWKEGYEMIPPTEFSDSELVELVGSTRRQVVCIRKVRSGNSHGPDDIVVLFRGTDFGSWTDIQEDLFMLIDMLHNRDRVRISRKLVEELMRQQIKRYNCHKIRLVGHSLGAAIALIVARKIHLDGKVTPECHLFNLPFLCLEVFLRQLGDFASLEYAVLALIMDAVPCLKSRLEDKLHQLSMELSKKVSKDTVQKAAEEFVKLTGFKPYIYVNEYDRVSNWYIHYFEHNSKYVNGMSSASLSKFTAILRSMGLKTEAHHLCPSATLVISKRGVSTPTSHPIKVWMNMDPKSIRCRSYTAFEEDDC